MNILRNLVVAFALLVGGIAPASAAAKFLVLCSTSCTWDNTNDAIWSTSSGGSNNTTHPVAGDTVTLDASSCAGGTTCTITTGAVTIAATSVTMGACTASTTGCILDASANNTNWTLASFSNSGTGTRNLKMGNGTWTLTGGTGNVWDQSTITNLTFNSNSSTLLIQALSAPSTSRGIGLGALTYNAVTINDPVETTKFSIAFFSGGSTITTLTVTNAYWIQLVGGGTTIVTNAFIWNNTSSTPGLLNSQSLNSGTTLSVGGAVTMTWVAMQNVTKAGAGSITCTNCFDLGGNSGSTITVPSGGGGRIIGGYLLKRDLAPAANDNSLTWVEIAA